MMHGLMMSSTEAHNR